MHENERDKWVIKVLSDNDADVEIVEDFILKLNSNEQLKRLLQFTDSRNSEVKLYAYEELIRFSDERVLEAAGRGLNESDELVRISAIEIIQEQNDLRQLAKIMELLKNDENELVRCFAGEAIGVLSENLIEFLEERIPFEVDSLALVGVYSLLYKLGRKEYLIPLLTLLKDDYHIIVIRTIIALKEILSLENQDLIFGAITRLKSQDLPVSINDALARCFPENHA
ncbi:HEAT repeat domain-containing protein [Listeria fleischmannii]|uniref:HEAT repeat domain-containing protein n=1 Tax=Listeria fleischmannii TaxID=1069827 RepID=UPI0016294346|nr:HEAT repeat domain-containing protein [Listeria fleischmannii]MBC1418908.1 HEAT repeat domain-containing protein [Listeria fleischmannii]